MDKTDYLSQIPNNPELSSLNPSVFFLKYIVKLIHDLNLFVEPDVTVGAIQLSHSYAAGHELMQKIIGIPSAFTGIDGNEAVLTAFAEKYAHSPITEYGLIAKDAIVDFMNLHNGLFVVELSKEDAVELSLDPPILEDVDFELALGNVATIPITFSFGTLTFLLIELDETESPLG